MSIFHRLYHSIFGGPVVLCPYCFRKFKLDKSVEGPPTCPESGCGRTIPINAPDYRNGLRPRLIGLIGAKSAGKTHFIASMLESIRRTTNEFHWTRTGLGDAIERYRVEFYEPVFGEGRQLAFTNLGVGKQPLTFKVSIRAPSGKLSVIFLTFFDTAGESFASEELIETESNYICNSDGLILLLDPLQLPYVRKQLEKSGSPKSALPARQLDTEDIIQRVSNLVRRQGKIRAQDKIRTPIAITFSKLDAFLGLCPPGSPLGQPSRHKGVFSESEFADIDAEIRTHLHDWDSSALVEQVTHNFTRSGYFALSALGHSPDAGGRLKEEITPMRVLDPLVWHLSLHGMLKKVK